MTFRSRTDNDLVADLVALDCVSRFVGGRDGRLHVLDFGKESRPLILIIPGITTAAVGMAFVAEYLSSHYRVVVMDNRGRGLSSWTSSYSSDDYIADVGSVLSWIGTDSAILIGHSMGARVAGQLAARNAEVVQGSILVEPPLSGPASGRYPISLATLMDEWESVCAGELSLAQNPFYGLWPEYAVELRERWLPTCDPRAIESSHREFESEDFFRTIAGLGSNCVIVYGETSAVIPADLVEKIRKVNSRLSTMGVGGAGHMLFWEAPEKSLQLMQDLVYCLLQRNSSSITRGN